MTTMQGAKGTILLRWIGMAMGLPALGAVVMLAGNANIAIKEIDESAIAREQKSVERGVALLGELHASAQMEMSTWDDAFQNIVTKFNKDWVASYFGSANYDNPLVQHMVILNAQGKAMYSSEVDGKLAPERAKDIEAAVAPAAKRLRDDYRKIRFDDQEFEIRQPGALSNGVHVNDLAVIEGKPAMITLSPFVDPNSDEDAPIEPTILLGINFMTDAMMTELAAVAHVERISVEELQAKTSAPADPTTEQTLDLKSADGLPVAKVRWPLVHPGSAVLKAQTPVIAATLLIIAALTGLAIVVMRRFSARVSDSEQAALYASRHDAATGLANRRWFMATFQQLLDAKAKAAAHDTRAVLLIDCDYFKTVNDTLGHAAGDAVLLAVAERMKSLGDKVEIAGRLGGDEFALITKPIAQQAIASMTEKISAAIMRPVVFEGHSINVSVSIGAAALDADSDLSIDETIAKADLALYRAKRDGRGCSRVFDVALDKAETKAVLDRAPANDRQQAA